MYCVKSKRAFSIGTKFILLLSKWLYRNLFQPHIGPSCWEIEDSV